MQSSQTTTQPAVKTATTYQQGQELVNQINRQAHKAATDDMYALCLGFRNRRRNAKTGW